jgi:hypothetical protein
VVIPPYIQKVLLFKRRLQPLEWRQSPEVTVSDIRPVYETASDPEQLVTLL